MVSSHFAEKLVNLKTAGQKATETTTLTTEELITIEMIESCQITDRNFCFVDSNWLQLFRKAALLG